MARRFHGARMWRALGAGLLMLVTGVTSALPAHAEPPPAESPTVTVAPAAGLQRPRWHRVDPRPSNEVLAAQLAELEARSRGRVEVRSIGASNEGRPLWSARVGHGPVRIMYVTQQHGDEPLGTPAAVELVRTVGLGNSWWHRWLRSRVTFDVVIRANPDGHVRNWRYNFDPDADPEFGQPGQGYDLNRYHSPSLPPEQNPATEAAHMQRAYAAFQPHILVDYHMQGRYRDAQGREITASLFWPNNPGVSGDVVDRSKQVVVVAQQAMTHLAGANVSQYPGGEFEGIARNAYGLRGSASVLVELSNMGPEHEADQMRSAYVAMVAIAQTAADGSLGRIDPARADAIPPRGEPIEPADAAYPLALDVLD